MHVFRAWAQQYGELFRIRVGYYNWVVVNSPQAMREIFDKQSISTSSKMPAPIGDDIVVGGMRMFTMPYGPKWRTYRTIVHRLLSPQMTQTFLPTQAFEVKQLMWDLATNNTNEMDFYRHVRRMSFSIIMTSTYGRRVDRWDHDDVRYAIESSKILGKITKAGAFIEDELPFLAHLPHWLQPSRKRAMEYAQPVLGAKMRLWNLMKEEVANGTAPPCFGKELMLSDYGSQGLVDEDAAWIAGGIVEAGSETSSVTLNNLILYLAANPEVQTKAYEEVTTVVGDFRAPVFEDVPQLPYVRASVKEILRLFPVPIWGLKHYTDNDVYYKNHVIPKGTIVLGNTSALHYDPARYEDPFAFRPERYLHHDKYAAEYAAMGDPYKRDHFSFGVGRRICPGSRLAENTLDLTLANLLWAFEIRPPVVIVDGKERDAVMDISDNAYEDTAFRAPKPFKARFLPRSEQRLKIVEDNWATARTTGYDLRGMHVDIHGSVRSKE
jgi:cytochrome P450